MAIRSGNLIHVNFGALHCTSCWRSFMCHMTKESMQSLVLLMHSQHRLLRNGLICTHDACIHVVVLNT